MGATLLLPGSITLPLAPTPPPFCIVGNMIPRITGEQNRSVFYSRMLHMHAAVIYMFSYAVSLQPLGVMSCSGVKKDDLDRWTERCRKVGIVFRDYMHGSMSGDGQIM